MPFRAFGLDPRILKAVQEAGYTEPTPIQAAAIPQIIAGHDLIGIAQTGTGKTAAFTLPMLTKLAAQPAGSPRGTKVLVIAPTRELVLQIEENIRAYARHLPLTVATVFGGVGEQAQIQALRSGTDVIIACPGRLLDLVGRRNGDFSRLQFLVLDEADRMLDMGFAPDVERILRQCPAQRQTLLFSATMPEWVRRLALRHMHDPETVEISTRPEIPAEVRQLYVQTTWADKTDAMAQILDQPDVVMALIFVETKRTADVLQAQLGGRGYQVGLLHGDLTQRERDRAMQQFRASHVKYLIATNVAARGLDIDDISHVINYDVPLTPDEYLHRVGRTGRAGRAGVAVTLITPSEILKLRDVEKHARTHIERATLDEDFPAVVVSAQA